MRRIVLTIMALWLSFGVAVHAQTHVQEFRLDASNNSIVRSIGDDQSLMLVEDSSGVNYFVLHEDNHPSALAFAMPSGIKVHDVRVWKDQTAYFCGTDTASNDAVAGFFDIASAFAGTGLVNYCGLSSYSSIRLTKATDAKRLDLYNIGSTVFMAMVGDALFDSVMQQPTTTVSVASYYGGNWHPWVYQRKPHNVQFTDIVCLDNTVVAVAKDTNSRFTYVKTFFRTYDFPRQPCMNGDFMVIDYGYYTYGDVFVTKMVDDTVAIASIDKKEGGSVVVHKVPIDNVTGMPVYPIETWKAPLCMPPSSSSGVLEMSAVGNRVWALVDAPLIPSPATDNWLMDVTLNSPAATAVMTAYNQSLGSAQCFDLSTVSHNPRLTCNDSRLLLYTPGWNASTGSCYISDTSSLSIDDAAMRLYQASENAAQVTPIPSWHTPVIEIIPSIIRCTPFIDK